MVISRHSVKALCLLPVVLVIALAGCGGSSSSTTSASSSSGSGSNSGSSSNSTSSSGTTPDAVSASTGDIPDNQVFLVYRNRAAGYSIKYPEGWARKGNSTDVTFSDKDNHVRVRISNGSEPSPQAAKAALMKEIPAAAALKINSAQTQTIAGAPAVHLTYQELGPSDPVTGKRLTIMVDRYVLSKGGKVATVDESTPVGVDNVDAFRLIIQSFRWS